MFDFFCELFGELKHGNYRYQVDGGKQIALEGYKQVLKAESEVVVAKLVDGEIKVMGSELKIKKLGVNTLIVTGQIKCVMVDEKQNLIKSKKLVLDGNSNA